MFRSGKDVDETPKNELETALRILRCKFWDRGLATEDQPQLRDKVDDELPVRVERLSKRVSPLPQLRVALAEKRPDQPLESLRQGRIRNVTLILVELARCKKASRRDQYLMEFIDDG